MIGVECFTSRTADTREALGALVFYLLGRDLPKIERRFCWALMEAWLAELVDSRFKA